jgi:succinate dehydrogenase / fumarate reductase cytochrome b subunit
MTTGEANTRLYPYASNRLYRLQRWSGVVAFFFILFHVLSLRVGVTLMGHLVTYRDVVNHRAPTPVLFFYLLGVLAALFHLCNGLTGFAWSWGFVESERSRTALRRASWVLFAVLAVPTTHLLLFLHQ